VEGAFKALPSLGLLSCTLVEDSLSSKYTLYTFKLEFDRLLALSGGLSLLPALQVYYCVVALLDLGLHSLFYGNSGAAPHTDSFSLTWLAWQLFFSSIAAFRLF